MLVVICGPNLIDQHIGQFHIHKAGCRDLNKVMYFGGGRGCDDQWVFEAESKIEIVKEVYQDIINEGDCTVEDLLHEFHFFTCCGGLK